MCSLQQPGVQDPENRTCMDTRLLGCHLIRRKRPYCMIWYGFLWSVVANQKVAFGCQASSCGSLSPQSLGSPQVAIHPGTHEMIATVEGSTTGKLRDPLKYPQPRGHEVSRSASKLVEFKGEPFPEWKKQRKQGAAEQLILT